jgi:hypothetical protein
MTCLIEQAAFALDESLHAFEVRVAGPRDDLNFGRGYTRIQGALANLGDDVGRGTIANVLSEHGIDSAPERGKRTSWLTFLKAHWDSIAATDFFTVEVLKMRGLVTYYIFFVIDLASREVKIAGITSRPDEIRARPRKKLPKRWWGR